MNDEAMMNDSGIFVDKKILSILYNNVRPVAIENTP
jgi:hypothetical protein